MSINVEAEKRAYAKFIAAGMTPAGACGLIGNLEAESDGFYPSRVEYLCIKRMKENKLPWCTDKAYVAAIDSGEMTKEQFLHPLAGKQYGFGYAQWTSPGRKSGLYDLAKKKGVSIADEDMQIEFLLNELKTSYAAVLKVLKTTSSIREASDIVLKKFEIPANVGETVCAGRAARGQKFYDNYVKKTEVATMANYDEYIKSTGTHYISNSGSDENGGYHGGVAGDQTGKEWQLRSHYIRPWNCVLRFEGDIRVGIKLAELGCAAALNDKIGYDQYQRDTYWKQLQAAGYDPSKITVACEADCSAGVIANVKAVGYLLGIKKLQSIAATYTGNMRAAFKAAGFTVLTDSKYLTSAEYLMPGDILLNDSHHTATNITKGKKAGSKETEGTATKNYLSKGDFGAEVKALQTKLIAVGYSCGSYGADGDFGSATDSALRKFQKDNGLEVDGKYGSKSKAKLEEKYQKMVSGAKKEIKVGTEVTFTGDKHYASANATTGKSCKGGKAKVTQIYQLGKSKHPYHIVAVAGGGSTVYGWVDEDKVKI